MHTGKPCACESCCKAARQHQKEVASQTSHLANAKCCLHALPPAHFRSASDFATTLQALTAAAVVCRPASVAGRRIIYGTSIPSIIAFATLLTSVRNTVRQAT